MFAGNKARMAVLLCLFTGAAAVRADEVAELRQQLQDQYKAITQMQAKLVELEQNQAAQGEKMATMKKEMTIPETLKWVEKIKF